MFLVSEKRTSSFFGEKGLGLAPYSVFGRASTSCSTELFVQYVTTQILIRVRLLEVMGHY